MPDFSLYPSGRIVLDEALLEVHYQEPMPVYNFTSVDNVLNALATSGSILASTYPEGLDIFNGRTGSISLINTATSGEDLRFSSVTELNLHRPGIPISGSIVAGRR